MGKEIGRKETGRNGERELMRGKEDRREGGRKIKKGRGRGSKQLNWYSH